MKNKKQSETQNKTEKTRANINKQSKHKQMINKIKEKQT